MGFWRPRVLSPRGEMLTLAACLAARRPPPPTPVRPPALLASRRALGAASSFPIDDGAGQPPLLPCPGHGGPHDVGGVDELLGIPVDVTDQPLAHWERQCHALLVTLVGAGRLSTDELRRGIESLEPRVYTSAEWGYYDKWAASIALGLVERGVLAPGELDAALGAPAAPPSAERSRFRPGDRVRVRAERPLRRWRKPHLRTPGYIFGARGVVERCEGAFADPEFLAFRARASAAPQQLYRVRFAQAELWPEGGGAPLGGGAESAEGGGDAVYADVYEPWLEPSAAAEAGPHRPPPAPARDQGARAPGPAHAHAESARAHAHAHAHEHAHAHGHEHLSRAELEQRAVDAEGREAPGERIVAALLDTLPARGALELEDVRRAIEAMDGAARRADGARLVARAWVDAGFRARLLDDASAAAAELGISATNATAPTVLRAVACTPHEHHIVVCTLCSCYPLSILGLSPSWYKSRHFRARAVREPRALLADSFGLRLPERTRVCVHDSTADVRYFVLPLRPPRTDGLGEAELARLVTRDTMLGVAQCAAPR